jgi:hypothetical protein
VAERIPGAKHVSGPGTDRAPGLDGPGPRPGTDRAPGLDGPGPRPGTDPAPAVGTDTAGSLEQAREAVAHEAWREAYTLLGALAPARLTPDDLDALADAAWWTGRVEESVTARTGAYSGYAAAEDAQPQDQPVSYRDSILLKKVTGRSSRSPSRTMSTTSL